MSAPCPAATTKTKTKESYAQVLDCVQIPPMHPLPPIVPIAVAAARAAAGYVHPNDLEKQKAAASDAVSNAEKGSEATDEGMKNPPGRSSSLVYKSSTKPCRYRQNIYHSKPGPLGLTIEHGEQCIVVKKHNQNSQLNVDDIILAVNGHRYDKMNKTEDGKAAWVNLFKGPGVREFDVLRQESNAVVTTGNVPAPLKDVSNTKVPVNDAVKMKAVKMPAVAAGSNCNERLLLQVSSLYTTGKGRSQTSQCKAAIRSCLLAGMRPFEIAKQIVKQLNPADRPEEYERAKSCAQRINRSMNKKPAAQANARTKVVVVQFDNNVGQDITGEDDSGYVPWAGASIVDSSDEECMEDDEDDNGESSDEELETANATKTAADIEDLLMSTGGIAFQINGAIFKRGDKMPKRKADVAAGGNDKKIACSTGKQSRHTFHHEQITQEVKLLSLPTADKKGDSSPVDMVFITPSNSLEEPMSPMSVA